MSGVFTTAPITTAIVGVPYIYTPGTSGTTLYAITGTAATGTGAFLSIVGNDVVGTPTIAGTYTANITTYGITDELYYQNYEIVVYDSIPYASNDGYWIPFNYPAYGHGIETKKGISMAYNGSNDGQYSQNYIRTYDRINGVWSDPLIFGVPSAETHGQPHQFVDNLGYIHVFYGAGDFNQEGSYGVKHLRSINRWDASEFDSLPTIGSQDYRAYPYVFQTTNDTMYVFSRWATNFYFEEKYCMEYSNDFGETWSDKQVILLGTGDVAYLYPYVLDYKTIDDATVAMTFTYQDINSPGNARFNVYYMEMDLITKHLFNIAGTDLGESVDVISAKANCLIYDSGAFYVNYPQMMIDNSGNVWVFFDRQDNEGIYHLDYIKSSNREFDDNYEETPIVSANDGLQYDVKMLSDGSVLLVTTAQEGTSAQFGGSIEYWSMINDEWTPLSRIMPSIYAQDIGVTYFCSPEFVKNALDESEAIFSEWDTVGANTGRYLFISTLDGFIIDGTVLKRGDSVADNSEIFSNSFGDVAIIYPKTGDDVQGQPVHGQPRITPCRIQHQIKRVFNADGEIGTIQGTEVWFDANDPVLQEDRILVRDVGGIVELHGLFDHAHDALGNVVYKRIIV